MDTETINNPHNTIPSPNPPNSNQLNFSSRNLIFDPQIPDPPEGQQICLLDGFLSKTQVNKISVWSVLGRAWRAKPKFGAFECKPQSYRHRQGLMYVNNKGKEAVTSSTHSRKLKQKSNGKCIPIIISSSVPGIFPIHLLKKVKSTERGPWFDKGKLVVSAHPSKLKQSKDRGIPIDVTDPPDIKQTKLLRRRLSRSSDNKDSVCRRGWSAATSDQPSIIKQLCNGMGLLSMEDRSSSPRLFPRCHFQNRKSTRVGPSVRMEKNVSKKFTIQPPLKCSDNLQLSTIPNPTALVNEEQRDVFKAHVGPGSKEKHHSAGLKPSNVWRRRFKATAEQTKGPTILFRDNEKWNIHKMNSQMKRCLISVDEAPQGKKSKAVHMEVDSCEPTETGFSMDTRGQTKLVRGAKGKNKGKELVRTVSYPSGTKAHSVVIKAIDERYYGKASRATTRIGRHPKTNGCRPPTNECNRPKLSWGNQRYDSECH